MTFEFDTREFRLSHSREPRGYGSWAFQFEGRDIVWAPSSTYADARKWVRAEIRKLAPRNYAGNVVIKVCT